MGIIPARGGSKSVPHKNIRDLGGKPLLAYACDSALESEKLSRVILSTDNEKIAEVGRGYGVEVPFLRPAELAQDDTIITEVLQHVVLFLKEQEGYSVDVVVVLQPTSPFRRAEHIDVAVKLLDESGANTVVSVVETPHQFSPVSLMVEKNGKLSPYLPGQVILRRQDKQKVFARNGPVVLAVRRENIESGCLYSDEMRPLIMNASDSLDIDSEEDFALAEYWLNYRKKKESRKNE